MRKKPRFNPEVTRVKLNPEQAVLNCECWDVGMKYAGSLGGDYSGCYNGSRVKLDTDTLETAAVGS